MGGRAVICICAAMVTKEPVIPPLFFVGPPYLVGGSFGKGGWRSPSAPSHVHPPLPHWVGMHGGGERSLPPPDLTQGQHVTGHGP